MTDTTRKYTAEENQMVALEVELKHVKEELVQAKYALAEEASRREGLELIVQRYLDNANKEDDGSEKKLDKEIKDLREVLASTKSELREMYDQKKTIEQMLQKYLEGFGSFEAVSRLNSLVESNPEAIVALDREGLVLEWNPAAEKVFGWKKEEVIGKPYPLVSDEHMESFNAVHSRVIRGEQVRTHQTVKKTKSGELLDVSISSMPLKNENEEIIGSSTIITDLTAFKNRSNQAKRLATVVEQSPNLITITDRNQVIEYVNQSMLDVTGYSAEELIGQKASILKSDKTPEKTLQELGRILSENGTFHGELVNRKKNGEYFQVSCSISPLRNEDGEITHYASIQEDLTEISKLKKELQYKSHYDALTGLNNEQSFKNRVDDFITRSKKEKTDHAVAIIDMDDFELINNNCGLKAGNELIKQAGKLIGSGAHSSDFVARIARDKFGMLMQYCTLQQAQQKVEVVRQSIYAAEFRCNNQSYNITVSIGLVPVNAESESVEEIISNGEIACNMAKEQGKNRSIIFLESYADLEKRHDEMELAATVMDAVDNDRLFLLYQPIIPLQDGDQLRSVEVSIKMTGGDGKVINAADFMPVAEKYGISSKIDMWVLKNAFSELNKNRKIMEGIDIVTINLSSKSIRQPDIQRDILDIVDKSDLPLSKLCFEIDELTASNRMSEVRQFLYAVKNRDCYISIDRFGHRISSYAYLQSIPFDFIKIDRSFTDDITEQEVEREFIKSINNIFHLMEKKTVAEITGSDAALEELKKIGIDYAQCTGPGSSRKLEELA